MGTGLDRTGLDRMEDVLCRHVEGGDVPGLTWAVSRHGDVQVGGFGVLEIGGAPVTRDSIFRIASMSKPVTAVAALILVEECVMRLDDPVDDLLPELADRKVTVDPYGSFDDTVPAERPITVRDLLTFELGWGMDFAGAWPQPFLEKLGDLGLGNGPPTPQALPDPDEWILRLSTLPLTHQPGSKWLYHIGSEVLSVLIARASGQPLDEFLRERVFEPLGMRDTAFWVPPDKLARFGASYTADPESGDLVVFDERDGQWTSPPAFPSGGGGLVSTVHDFLAFASMLLAGGAAANGTRIISPGSVAAMTTDQRSPEAAAISGPDPDGAAGWGFGVSVVLRKRTPAHNVGAYGWDGGLGTSWVNDPSEGLIGVLLTNRMFTTSSPPAYVRDFWTTAYAAVT